MNKFTLFFLLCGTGVLLLFANPVQAAPVTTVELEASRIAELQGEQHYLYLLIDAADVKSATAKAKNCLDATKKRYVFAISIAASYGKVHISLALTAFLNKKTILIKGISQTTSGCNSYALSIK